MFPYEHLEVYKKAFQLNQKIYGFIKFKSVSAPYIKNQLGRASLSIMLNIAEGSAKFSGKDKRNYFITARGSAFECSSLIIFLSKEAEIPETLERELYSSLEEISKMLFAMINNLHV